MPLYNKQKYNTNLTHFIVTKLTKMIIIGLSGQALPLRKLVDVFY